MNKIEEMFWAALSAFFAAGIVYVTYISPPGWLEANKDAITTFIWWLIGVNVITLMFQRAKQLDKFRRRAHHSEHYTDGCKYS